MTVEYGFHDNVVAFLNARNELAELYSAQQDFLEQGRARIEELEAIEAEKRDLIERTLQESGVDAFSLNRGGKRYVFVLGSGWEGDLHVVVAVPTVDAKLVATFKTLEPGAATPKEES